MSDADFNRFLFLTLAPEAREPDRDFVAVVQTRIRLEDLVMQERRRTVSILCKQLLGVAALAAAAVWLLQAPAVSELAARMPAQVFAAVIGAFSLFIATLSVTTTGTMPRNNLAG